MPASPSRAPWRLLRTPPLHGAANMALDEALLHRAARTGEWVLRVYEWTRPTLSLGRNQTARGRYRLAEFASLGIDVVRRPTGGRAILHDREATYSVTAPVATAGTLRDSYERINRLLVAGLRDLDVDATIAGARAPRRPGVAPCFEEPAEGELVAGGRKLVGSAQWREADALLQHGSILLAGDQALVASLLVEPLPAPPPPATLSHLLGRPVSATEVAAALEQAVRRLEDPAATALDEGEQLLEDARRRAARYADHDWTWRL